MGAAMSEEMMPSRELPEPLRDMERVLAGFAPAAAHIDRDQLMFEAGRAAGAKAKRTHGPRLWKGICGVLVLASAAFAVFPRTRVVERVVMRESPAGIQAAAPTRGGPWLLTQTPG